MGDVQRFFGQLVRALSNGDVDRSRDPIEIAEIYQSVLPYRRYRKALRVESNQDYEMVLLRLLAGEGGYASVDPVEVQDALIEEINSVNPNPGAFRDYAAAKVYLNSSAVQTLTADFDEYAPPPSVLEELENDTPPVEEYAPPDPEGGQRSVHIPFMTDPADVSPLPGLERAPIFSEKDSGPRSCPDCMRDLPRNRHVKFCPYCGSNVETRRCPACQTDLAHDWKYCITCGTTV